MQTNPLQKIKILPPFYFLFALAIGWVLELYYPLDLFRAVWIYYTGLGMIVFSFGLAIWSAMEFKRANTSIDVRQNTTSMVTSGPYRFSRNPLYLSVLLLTVGLSLSLNLGWVIGALILIVPLFHYKVIKQEETYLLQLFEDEYRRYKKTVRSWI